MLPPSSKAGYGSGSALFIIFSTKDVLDAWASINIDYEDSPKLRLRVEMVEEGEGKLFISNISVSELEEYCPKEWT